MIDTIFHLRIIENKDWATILFVISFATVAITKSAFENRFADFAKLIYSDKYINIYKDGNHLNSGFTIALFFVQLISFAFFIQISFSHFIELIKIDNNIKRKFYELSVIKNTLSVRELERQIATLTYERVGLSANTDLVFQELKNKIIPETTNDAIKSIYFFDFLNLPNAHLVQENQLEEALINHLEKFIIELGNGFCFEARQKRILIDDEYYFVDLVFFHRLLKCHILIELKVDKFKHEHLSQLNSYVGFYNDQVKQIDDNPTIGILLCTEKGNKMVEYALAGMEEKLFVSKYLVQLPQKEQLIQFIENELKNNDNSQ